MVMSDNCSDILFGGILTILGEFCEVCIIITIAIPIKSNLGTLLEMQLLSSYLLKVI